MADKTQEKPSIIISGATGYVGVHLADELTRRHIPTVCLTREASNPKDIRLLESMGTKICPVDFKKNSSALEEAMKSAEGRIRSGGQSNILVHLIGSIAPKKGVNLEELQTKTAKLYFEAAKKAGIQKVILVTAVGCRPDAASEYHRTKGLAEEALRKSGLTYVIFRPSLIVGRTAGYRDSKMVRRYVDLIQKKNKVPLVFGGRNRIQPVFVGDLVQAIIKVALEKTWDNSTLEFGGEEALTTRAFVERLMKAMNQKKDFLEIPAPLAWCAASLCEIFQEVPLISHDQLKIASMDSVPAENALISTLHLKPTPLDQALACYADGVHSSH